ncbi:MAG: tetratricopeptide repeat protein [Vicinamibacterales bacterium]
MVAAIKCAACGTKTYARRTHCPRCRAPLTAAPAAQPAPQGQARRRTAIPIAIVCVVALVLTAGVAVQLGTSSASATPSPGSPPAAVRGPSGANPQFEGTSKGANSMDLARGGVAAYAKGDVAGSIEQFMAAVEADPKNGQALNNLGQALVRAGRAREAIPYFDQAIAVTGSVWTYHFNRAKAYGELQDWSRAVAGYRQAAGLFPQDYATAFNLARALQESGDLNGAIDEFQRAINLAPGEADFPLALAYALESARRPGDAVSAYRRYLELQDSGPTAEKVRQRIEELESNR